MNNQDILDNAPDGAVCVDDGNDYFNEHGVMWAEHCKHFDFHDKPEMPCRSLADIKRIVELEEKLWRTEQESEQAVNRAAEMIEHRDKRIAELENQWISVEDRLPDELQNVLSFDDFNGVVHSIYRSKAFKKANVVWEQTNVTHWQKLPSPPKEQTHENS